MCGIAGIYAYRYAANAVDCTELRRIRDHMAARGPDGLGEWYSQEGHVALGHRRLAILDLSERGAQPMASVDGKVVVTFNGEIYNYRQLRAALEAKGRTFRTATDTEVLLHLYAEKGEAMVEDLRGMFAFGLWDAEKNALLLARDPYGIKPLYYADDGGTVRFASQVKALVAGGSVSSRPDAAGWASFYLFGSVIEPYTTYEAIRAVPAGTIMWFDPRGPKASKLYFSIARVYSEAERQASPLHDNELQEQITAALLDSVRHHLVADVPVGAFLSAGVDSGSLVGLMCTAGQQQFQTVTLAFEEFRGTTNDESDLAARVAKLYGTRHSTRVVTEQEFRGDLPKILEAMDQPTIDGINTWFVSKAAKEQGLKVAISGLGGDELFGGYPSFRDVPHWVRLLALPARAPMVGRAFRSLVNKLNERSLRLSPKTAGLLSYGGTYAGAYLLRRGLFMPWELEQLMEPDWALEGMHRLLPLERINQALTPTPRSAFAKVAALEASIYMRNQLLRDTDWASMAHSLEVRVPLVDKVLLETLSRIIGNPTPGAGKRWLSASPRPPLPEQIWRRPKTGFTIPIQAWLNALTPASEASGNFSLFRGHWSRRWAIEVVRRQGIQGHQRIAA
jgi:asparagine synthase (glutamine-hydrolysing)